MTSPESVFGFRRIFLTHRVLRDSLPRTRHIHIRRNFHMNRNTSCHSFSNHRKPDAKPSVVSGFFFCLLIAVAAAILGRRIPVIGGPVFAILLGMIITIFMKNRTLLQPGITFVSKKILQFAVILLGFGLNLNIILETGRQSLPIIAATITAALIIAALLQKLLHIPVRTAVLVGVGSAICGGSAIAAAAPVIGADDEEVAQSISVIFLFKVIAALFFPFLGGLIGFSTTDGEAFGIFVGTAVNDTSSVTAAASTWDSIYGLGNATLDKAVTVKLTRTLAIIPITLFLAFFRTKKAGTTAQKTNLRKVFPYFILAFAGASVITTAAVSLGASPEIFTPFKSLSKFFIIMAMAAIGLNTNIVRLIRTGGKPILAGLCCWMGITLVSLLLQWFLGIW